MDPLFYQGRPCGTKTRLSNRWTKEQLHVEAISKGINPTRRTMDELCHELIKKSRTHVAQSRIINKQKEKQVHQAMEDHECPILEDFITSEEPLTKKEYLSLRLIIKDEKMKDIVSNYPLEKVNMYKYFDLLEKNSPKVDNDGHCGFNIKRVSRNSILI